MEGIYKKLAVLLAIVLTSTFASCGGGGGGTTPATGTDPISLDSIGSDGVAADSSFLYTFSKAVDTSLVDTSSFFMHTATSGSSSISMKDAYDSTTCDVSQAIAATVTCSSSTACVLDPTSDLTAGATYIACILPGTASSENIMASNNLKETNSPGTGIFFDDETAFDGYSKQILIEGTAVAADTSCTDPGDCESGSLCMYDTCATFAEAGFTEMECDDEAEVSGCPSGKRCFIAFNIDDCDTSYCVDTTIFLGDTWNRPATEAACDAIDDFWDEDGAEACLPGVILECLEILEVGEGDGGDDNCGATAGQLVVGPGSCSGDGLSEIPVAVNWFEYSACTDVELHGLAHDGTNLWVSEFTNNRINRLVDGTTDAVFSSEELTSLRGITFSALDIMWIASGNTIFKYNVNSGECQDSMASPGEDNTGVTFMASGDDNFIWNTGQTEDKQIYRLDMADGSTDFQFTGESINGEGMTYHDGSLYVCDFSGSQIHRYDASNGDFLGAMDSPDCIGLTNDGTYFYASTMISAKIYRRLINPE